MFILYRYAPFYSVYVFASDEAISLEETQLSNIMTYMKMALPPENDNNKYIYALLTGERFGISIELSDSSEKNLCIKLYQENDLIRDNNANSFSLLENRVLDLSKHPYG
jgi:hypothetical protein